MNSKRKALVVLLLCVAMAALVAGLRAWWQDSLGDDEPVAAKAEPQKAPAPTMRPIRMHEGGGEALKPVRQLKGVVRDAKGPASGVEVLVFAPADSQPPPSPCANEGEESLFFGSCDEAFRRAMALVDAGGFDAVALSSTRSAEDGSFTVGVPAGPVDLFAQGPQGSAEILDVEAEEGDEPLELVLQPPVQVHGHAQDLDGTPLADVEITLVHPRPMRAVTVHTGADGRFTALAPAAAEYGIVARAAGYAPFLGDTPADDDVLIELTRPFRIEGRVVLDGKAAAGAEVELADVDRHVTADAQGRFSFDDAACSLCVLNAHTETAVGSAEVTALRPLTQVDIVLVAAGTLHVRLVDDVTKEALSAGQVDVMGGESWPTLESDGAGAFVAKRVAHGSYVLSCTAPGYVRRDMPVLVDGDGATVEVALHHGLAVKGRVVDERDAPVVGASVSIDSEQLQTSSASAETDAKGEFTLEGLESGSHRLTVEHEDFVSAEELVAMPHPSPVVVRLRRAALAVVSVADPDGRPLEGAHVLLTSRPSRAADSASALTDEQGEAHLERLTPGSYVATASAHGFVASEETPLEVKADGSSQLKLQLRRGLSLSGSVVDDRGTPVPRASVYCVPQATGTRGRSPETQVVEADEAGHFTASGLEQTKYAVSAESPGGSTSQPVIAEAGERDVQVVLQRMGSVTGRVTFAGAPVQRFTVEEELVQSSTGTFRHAAAAGATTLVLSGDFVPVSVQVEVKPGGELDVGEVKVHRGGGIEGVATRGGAPVVGLSVEAHAQDLHDVAEASSDGALAGASDWTLADGRFRFQNLPPGRYRVTAHGPEGVATPVEVNVAEGQPAKVQLELKPGGRISGVLRAANGEPVPRARVTVVSDDVALSVRADSSGNFLVEGLPPGTYRVSALSVYGKPPPSALVAVDGGREAHVELVSPAATPDEEQAMELPD